MGEIVHKDLAYQLVGACFEVYNEKGSGFAEAVYQECLEIELALRGIPFLAQPRLQITYKGQALKHPYVPEILGDEKVIVELKAIKCLTDEHRGQVINYLKATGLRLGLLVNFGHPERLEWERLVL